MTVDPHRATGRKTDFNWEDGITVKLYTSHVVQSHTQTLLETHLSVGDIWRPASGTSKLKDEASGWTLPNTLVVLQCLATVFLGLWNMS